MILRLETAAATDADEVVTWYDQQRSELGDEFLLEFQACLSRIVQGPLPFAKLEGRPRGSEIRRCLMDRFPYLIIYQVRSTEVVVLAVIHTQRSLRAWRKRLK